MDHKDFMVIYPSYLDSSKTLKQGLRIGKEHGVDTPTVSDISQALQQLGLRHVLQPHKGYSRDPYSLWDNPGRVKVERSKISMADDPCSGSKRPLLLEIASRIPALPSRIQRLQEQAKAAELAEQQRKEELQKLQQQQKQKQSSSQQSQQPSVSKKKGKKKR